MQHQLRQLCGAVGVVLFGLGIATASAGQTSTTEVRKFEVISVEGNQVVVRAQDGTSHEYTVPEDFRFTVDGKQVSVRELRPGMRGAAAITTTTTTKPVNVTEVRNAEVLRVMGNSIIVRGPEGIRRFSQQEVDDRGVSIIRNGRPAQLSQFRTGDRLTATIVTEHPPEVLTEQQVEAVTLSAAPAPASGRTGKAAVAVATRPAGSGAAPAAAPTAGAANQGASGTTGSARQLPKTASPLPLLGALGALFLSGGAVLSTIRRCRAKG